MRTRNCCGWADRNSLNTLLGTQLIHVADRLHRLELLLNLFCVARSNIVINLQKSRDRHERQTVGSALFMRTTKIP